MRSCSRSTRNDAVNTASHGYCRIAPLGCVARIICCTLITSVANVCAGTRRLIPDTHQGSLTTEISVTSEWLARCPPSTSEEDDMVNLGGRTQIATFALVIVATGHSAIAAENEAAGSSGAPRCRLFGN